MDWSRITHLLIGCNGVLIDERTGILNSLRPILADHDMDRQDDEILRQYHVANSDTHGPKCSLNEVLGRTCAALGVPSSSINNEALDLFHSPVLFDEAPAAIALLRKRFRLGLIADTESDPYAIVDRLWNPFDTIIERGPNCSNADLVHSCFDVDPRHLACVVGCDQWFDYSGNKAAIVHVDRGRSGVELEVPGARRVVVPDLSHLCHVIGSQ